MKQLFIIITSISIALCSCTSSNVIIQNPQALKGKKLGIAYFNLAENVSDKLKQPADTICACISEFIINNLTPYLQQSGMGVVSLSENKKMDLSQTFEKADSLKVDHVLFGSATVRTIGKHGHSFLDTVLIKVIHVKTREVSLTASFSAPYSGSERKQIRNMGKKIIALMK